MKKMSIVIGLLSVLSSSVMAAERIESPKWDNGLPFKAYASKGKNRTEASKICLLLTGNSMIASSFEVENVDQVEYANRFPSARYQVQPTYGRLFDRLVIMGRILVNNEWYSVPSNTTNAVFSPLVEDVPYKSGKSIRYFSSIDCTEKR